MSATARQCWICYGEEESEESTCWLRPCACKGSTQWVHQACLLGWVEQRVRTEPYALVTPALVCPQCQTPYRFSESYIIPRPVLLCIDHVGKMVDRALLLATIGGVAAGLYSSCFVYGLGVIGICLGGAGAGEFAARVVQPLVSAAKGQRLDASVVGLAAVQLFAGVPLVPLYVLSARFVGLAWLYPLIPPLLYCGPESLRWQWPPSATLLCATLPFVHVVYQGARRLVTDAATDGAYESGLASPVTSTTATDSDSILGDDRSVQTAVLGTAATLLFPALAAATGWLVFGRTRIDGLHRTVLGATLLLLAKDAFQALLWYQNIHLRTTRRVLNVID